jgi:hypothetical protein
MPSREYDQIQKVNVQMASQLADAQRALAGQGEFHVEHVRALSKIVVEMAPIMARAEVLRNLEPEIAEPLNIYRSQLKELRFALQRLQMMLVAKRAEMDARRDQMDAVSRWATTLSQTR